MSKYRKAVHTSHISPTHASIINTDIITLIPRVLHALLRAFIPEPYGVTPKTASKARVENVVFSCWFSQRFKSIFDPLSVVVLILEGLVFAWGVLSVKVVIFTVLTHLK